MAKREANILVTLRDRASAGLRRLGGVASGLAKTFGLVTAAATAITTIIGARFLSGAIRSAGEFDEQMSIVGAVTQATAEDMELLRNAADEAGSSTRFTATEAAQGLEELARSGQNATQAVATLNPALNLAAGNNQTVAESALQVTTALNAFGLAAEEAGRVSDVFTRAAQRSAQTTGQLGEAMTFVAPVARQAGIDIEQTAALIGRLADAGFRGSLGGTALRNAILQFQDPASRFRSELERLGIRTDNFVDALAQLSGAGDDAEAAIRSLGLRAGPAIQAIVAGAAPALRELTEELRNAEGASQEAAAALEDNLPGAIRGFASAFDAARRRLVEPLVGRITQEIQNLTVRLREFTASGTIDEFAQLLKDAFDTGVRAVRDFLGSVDFTQVRENLVEFARNARERLREFGSDVEGVRRNFQIVTGAIQTFVGVIGTAFNALGTVIAGAVTLVNGIAERYLAVLDTITLGTISKLGEAREAVSGLQLSLEESTREFAQNTGRSFAQVQQGWANMAGSAEESAKRQVEAADQVDKAARKNIESQREWEEQQKRNREGLDRARKLIDAWDESVDDAAESTDRLAESGGRAGDAIGGVADAAGDATTQLFRIEGSAGSLQIVTSEAENTSAAFDGLAAAIDGATSQTQLESLTARVERLAAQGDLTEQEIRALISAINDQAAAMQSASISTEGNTRSLQDLAGAASGTAGALGEVGRQARGATQGAKSLVQGMGAAIDIWRDAGPEATRRVEDFIRQWNLIGLFTFEGARNRVNRFTEGMVRDFGPAEQAIKEFNESVREADRDTQRLDRNTRSLDGATLDRNVSVTIQVVRDPQGPIALREADINAIVSRVLDQIETDGDRTG